MTVPELSVTEERIVLLSANGASNARIAATLDLDERTVSWHLARATRKLERVSILHRRLAQRNCEAGALNRDSTACRTRLGDL